jgi:integrase
MANDLYRRCGCRDENGKQLGSNCPQLSDSKHGTWGYYVNAGKDPRTGKRLQHRKTGFPTKKAAQTARNEVAAKVDKGTFVAPTKESFAEFLDTWLPRRATTGEGLKPTTYSTYERYIRNDIKTSGLGVMMLTDIRTYHINDFLAELTEAGRGAVTVRRVAAVVQSAMRDASRSRRIEANPATGLELPTVTKSKMKIWEPEQVGVFLDTAATHRLGPLFELDMFTGLRRAEIIGLRWEDVDLPARRLTVRNTRVQADKNIVEQEDTKTEAGRRIVELDDRAVGALIAWRIQQSAEAEEWGDIWANTGHVFTYDNGEPLKPQYVTRLFDKLRVEAGLPKLTFHGSRHEHASLLKASGADIAIVSKRLGHTNLATTSDLYTHLIGSASRNAAENASALVPSKKAVALTVHTQAEISV